MKVKLLTALLLISSAWALTASWLYWDLHRKSQAYLSSPTEDLSRQAARSLEVNELTNTITIFIEGHFSYTEKNFLSQRRTTSRRIAPTSRSEYMAEAERLAKKIQKRNIDYRANLLELFFADKNSFRGLVEVHLRSDNRRVLYEVRGEWERTVRSLENIEGLYINKIQVSEVQSPRETQITALPIKAFYPVTLNLPCHLENNTPHPAEAFLVKTTNQPQGSVSEILILDNLPVDAQIEFLCKEISFTLQFQESEDEYISYYSINRNQGTLRNIRKKDSYDLLIDKVLGDSKL